MSSLERRDFLGRLGALVAVPAGLQVTVDGQPRTTPIDIVGVVGTQRQLGAPSPQTLGATQYVFQGWSDGGSVTHNIATPETNTTYVATFTAATVMQTAMSPDGAARNTASA